MKINFKSPTSIFFLIAFGIPWVIWSLMNIVEFSNSTKGILIYAGDFCSVGGLVAAYLAKGKSGFKMMFTRLIDFRFSFKWILICIGIPFIYLMIAFSLGSLYEIGRIGELNWSVLSKIYSLPALAMLLTGPIGEEFGWRGYLLPKLLEKHSPLTSSVILGFLWGIWHYPLYMNDIYGALDTAFIFTAHTILLSIIMTVIYLHTNGNILLAIILSVFKANPLVRQLMIINLLFAWYSLIPLPGNLGLYLFYPHIYFWTLTVGIVLAVTLMVFFLNPILTLIFGIMAGVFAMVHHYTKIDNKFKA